MKTNKLLIILIILITFVSCDNDDNIVDPVFEFIAFQKKSVGVNEAEASITPFPIVIDLLGYEPTQDITINLTVTENNAVDGVDYTLSTKTLVVKKGTYTSDTLYISTIDNLIGSLEERSIDISIASTSNSELNIGLGLDNPTNGVIRAVIIDDECSDTTDVFNSENISNETPWGTFPVTGNLNGNVLTLQGDLIAYGPFPNAKLEVTLNPISNGATKGSVTFEQQVAGTDNDGYVYAFKQVGEGTFDVCSGVVEVEYEVYYESGGSWAYWYTITNTFYIE